MANSNIENNGLQNQIVDLRKEMSGQFEEVAQQFEQIDQRFEQIDQRFEQIDRRFEQIDQRFEKVDQRFEKVDQRFEKVDQRFDKVEQSVERLALMFFEEKQSNQQFREYVQKNFDQVLSILDNMSKQYVDLNQERFMEITRNDRQDKMLSDHEQRITTLESTT